MLFRLVTPVTNFLKPKPAQPAAAKAVPELLVTLAEVRAKKADLERQEKEIVAATQAGLRAQQEALEGLKKKIQECGIEIDSSRPA
jgi:hypothetical protein